MRVRGDDNLYEGNKGCEEGPGMSLTLYEEARRR